LKLVVLYLFIGGGGKKNKNKKSNITSREIKWKKGRVTRLGCWGCGTGWVVWDELHDSIRYSSRNLQIFEFCCVPIIEIFSHNLLGFDDSREGIFPTHNMRSQITNEPVGCQSTKSRLTKRRKKDISKRRNKIK